MTVIVPEVGPVPALLTVIVYVPVEPTVNVPEWDFFTCRSMELTVSVAVLLTAPVADSFDDTPLVVLASEPGTVLVTWTAMVQLELAGMRGAGQCE